MQAPDTARRYDPALTPVQQWTAIAQLTLWLGAILAFLWHADASSFQINAAMLGLTLAGLWVTGALLESAIRVRWAWCLQAVFLSPVMVYVAGS